MSNYLITGAGRGLGSQMAKALASEGHRVFGLSRSPVDNWSFLPNENFIGFCCDLTNERDVKGVFSEIRKSFGWIDVLVNNAGVSNAQLLQITSGEQFASVLNTNLIGSMTATREAAKMMRQRNWGRVVSISSVATSIHLPGNALYGLSKQGLEQLMRGFAVEFRNTDITFNSIAISFVNGTGMVETLSVDARTKYETRLLKPDPLDIAEILNVVKFFASDLAKAVTGQTIHLGSPE